LAQSHNILLLVLKGILVNHDWVVPEKIHNSPKEDIPAVQRGRGEKFVSDNWKCSRTSKGGRG
jgi:hypothetical protein